MKHPRLYVPLDLAAGRELELPAEAANHVRVLRLPAGNPLTLFNGQGGEFLAELLAVDKRQARVRLIDHLPREAESQLRLTLVQGISKGDRMDYTIQKAVELGVQRIVPVFTERSVVQLDGERLAKREEHWRGVVASACEQCGRNRLPLLLPAVPLARAWPHVAEGLGLVLDPGAETGLRDLNLGGVELSLLVGPEGGLSDAEVAAAKTHGFHGVRLGPRILRTETAGVAALAALQALAGDLG